MFRLDVRTKPYREQNLLTTNRQFIRTRDYLAEFIVREDVD